MNDRKMAGQKKSLTQALANNNENLPRSIVENFPDSYISIIEKDLTVSFSAGQEFKKQNLDPNSFNGLHISEIFGPNTQVVKEHYLATFMGEQRTLFSVVLTPLSKLGIVPQILYFESAALEKFIVNGRFQVVETALFSQQPPNIFIAATKQ